jgi:hypothetical protein
MSKKTRKARKTKKLTMLSIPKSPLSNMPDLKKIPAKDLKNMVILGNKIQNEMRQFQANNKTKLNKLKKCVKQNCKKFTQKKAKENCIQKHCKNETDALVNDVADIIKKNVSKKDIKNLGKIFKKPK